MKWSRSASSRRINKRLFARWIVVQSSSRCRKGAPSNYGSYRKKPDVTIVVGECNEEGQVKITSGSDSALQPNEEQYAGAFFESPLDAHSDVLHSQAMIEASHARNDEQLRRWIGDGYWLIIAYSKPTEKAAVEHYNQLITQESDRVFFVENGSNAAFVFPDGKLAVVNAAGLLGNRNAATGRRGVTTGGRRGLLQQRSQIDFTELDGRRLGGPFGTWASPLPWITGSNAQSRPGRFCDAESTQEVMVLEFAEGTKLFVPLEQAFLVSRYVGLGKRGVTLSQLGDGKWNSTKKAAEKSIYDYAAQLLKNPGGPRAAPGFRIRAGRRVAARV